MNALFLAATVVLAACPAALPAQTLAPAPARTETLRLKFTAGQALSYSLTENTSGSYLEPHGRLTPIKSHLETAQTLTVMGLRDADSAGLVDVGLGAMTVTVDGKPAPGDRTAAAQAALENLAVMAKLVVLPSGKIVETQVNPALDADEALTGEDPTHMNALAWLGELPPGSVQVGSKWKSAVFLGLSGEQSTADLTLTGWETKDGAKDGDPVAVITQVIRGSFVSPIAPTASPIPPPPKSASDLRIKGWVSGTRTVRLNLALGCVESAEGHVYMTVLLTSRDGDGKFTGPPTRMWVQATSKLTRTAAPPEKPAKVSAP